MRDNLLTDMDCITDLAAKDSATALDLLAEIKLHLESLETPGDPLNAFDAGEALITAMNATLERNGLA